MPPGPDPEKKPEMTDPPGQPPPARPPAPNRPPAANRPPPPRRALAPKLPPPRRRHHRGRTSRARIGLVVIFILFGLVDFMWINAIKNDLRSVVYPTIIVTALWTTALLIAIELRHGWARLLLLGVLGLIVIGTLVLISWALQAGLIVFLGITSAVYAGSFAWLFYSRDVRRLTGRDFE